MFHLAQDMDLEAALEFLEKKNRERPADRLAHAGRADDQGVSDDSNRLLLAGGLDGGHKWMDDLDATLARCRAAGVRLVDETPRLGAEGKRIAFLHPAATAGVLVELTEC